MKRPSLATLGTSAFTALLMATLEMIFVISFAALIYSGELAGYVPQALGFIILGDAILCLVVALLSTTPGVLAVEQDVPGVMLSVIAAGVIAVLSGAPQAQFATVTLLIVLTTTLTGLILLLLGLFKMGDITRFLPYPIIGGFLAGSGWLLVEGAISLMTDSDLGLVWLQGNMLQLWVPGLVLGVIIYFTTEKFDKPYTIPAMMLLALLVFYGFAWMRAASPDQLRAAGWLLNSSAAEGVWQFPLRANLLGQVNWEVLFRQIPAVLPISLICAIDLLLGSSGLELIIKKDIDLNRELVVAGVANLAAGLSGGLVGFQDLSFSSLNQTLSGGKKLVAILTALFLGATLFVGSSALLYVPKFILGSALVLLGVELLVEWVYQAWFKFPRIDFIVIISILIVIIVRGFLEGILVGLVMAVIMFVVSYSQVSVIKFALTGREYRSRVTRTPFEQQILETYGEQAYLLKLEGFIFFGTANRIFTHIRSHIQAGINSPVKYILLDFAKVSGMDSTGMLSFSRMVQWCQECAITLLLTGLAGRTEAQVIKEPSLTESDNVKRFSDLDHGLEWYENQLIARHLKEQDGTPELEVHLQAILQNENTLRLLPYLQRQEYHPGEYLMREGDAPDFIYFIESGLVTAQLEPPDKLPVRLETMGGGRTVGELGFYLGAHRTAHVICEQDAVVYTLSTEDLKRMETEDSEAASLIHRIIVRLLSERVTHLTRTISALERS